MKRSNDELVQSLRKGPASKPKMPDLSFKEERNIARVSNNICGSVFAKRDITSDYKWRKDSAESKQTIAAIKRKAASIAPAYNKGALQLPIDTTPEEIAAGRRR